MSDTTEATNVIINVQFEKHIPRYPNMGRRQISGKQTDPNEAFCFLVPASFMALSMPLPIFINTEETASSTKKPTRKKSCPFGGLSTFEVTGIIVSKIDYLAVKPVQCRKG